jgi:uracil-DNA glycosylase family 4
MAEKVDVCTLCPFRSERACGSKGPPDAEFVIVGEAPGGQELVSGIPFVGPSGKMLDAQLTKNGIRTADVYITNALRCRPPIGKPPPKQAIDACRDRLSGELKAYPRRVILALGNTALRALTGNYNLKITQERGKVIETEFGTVVSSLHPANILRNPGEFKKLAADITLACDTYRNGTIRRPGPTSYTMVTEAYAERVINTLLTKEFLSVDIETAGWHGDQFNPRKGRILSVGIGWAVGKVVIFLPELFERLRRLFDSTNTRFIWHNGKFDSSWFDLQYNLTARVDEDTMLMHYALNEERGTHDLKQLSTEFLGAEDYEAEMQTKYLKKKSDSYEMIPPAVLHKYQAYDCDYTLQLFFIFRSLLVKKRGLIEMYRDVLIPASRFLQRVEKRGIYLGRDTLDEVDAYLAVEREKAIANIQPVVAKYWDADLYTQQSGAKKTPEQFNPGSTQQLGWLLFNRIGMKQPHMTTGTGEDVLLAMPKHPIIAGILGYRGVVKSKGTYVDGPREAIQADGRVHSTYMIHGTKTGRLSSREPNNQNWDRDYRIRRSVQAPEGRWLLECDYNQAELRVLAFLSGDKALMQVYIEGRDLHNEVAIRRFGPNFTSEQRVRIKFLNFGIVYGRGAESIAKEFGISIQAAREDIASWTRQFPDAMRYINLCRTAPELGRALITPFGRRRRFGLVNRQTLNALQNEAANFPVQSTASDLTLLSSIRVDPFLTELDSFIINLVHDSNLNEIPADLGIAQVVAQRITTVMEWTPRLLLGSDVMPFKAEAKVGQYWGSSDDPKIVEQFDLLHKLKMPETSTERCPNGTCILPSGHLASCIPERAITHPEEFYDA